MKNNDRKQGRKQGRKLRLAVFLAAVLVLCLLAACEKPPDETTEPPNTDGNVTQPPITEEQTNTTDAPPSAAPPTDPGDTTAQPPRVTYQPLTYPDLDGMEKNVDENAGLASYNNGNVTLQVQLMRASEAQLDEARSKWGDELKKLSPVLGEVIGDELVDVSGLNRKGLKLDVDFDVEGYTYLALIIPLDTQIVAVTGFASEEFGADLQNYFDELLQNLSL